MILSSADSIKLGSSNVDKLYVGDSLVFFDGKSVTSFIYDSLTFTLQSSEANGRPQYQDSVSTSKITWNGTYWLFSDFRAGATFTPINPVQTTGPFVPGEDTAYPFWAVDGTLRSEFSNLVT